VLNGAGTLDGPTETLPKLYSLSSGNFHDVNTGNNGYPAVNGYDLVTGLGTPVVNQLVSSLAGSRAPSIGSLTVNPNSVQVGTPVSLVAANVSETGGTVAGVTFYRETNNTAGLQIGSDTLVGSGTHSGSTWTLAASTAGLAPGTYTFYAVATDAAGATSAVPSATLTVVSPPTIGSFVVNPSSIPLGMPFSLVAANVAETGAAVTSVRFFRESNNTPGLQLGTDTLIGSGTPGDSAWSFTTSSAALAPGTYTLYAIASDARGFNSAVSTATLTVTAIPTIGSFTITPTSVTAGTSVSLAAVNVAEIGGTVKSVQFYRESNGTAGLQTGTDVLVGSGVQIGSTWSLTASTTGLAAGTYVYYAVAIDAQGVSSVVASATLSVKNPAPPPQFNRTTSSSLSCSVTSQGIYDFVTLTVKVSVAAGQPAPTGKVSFYMSGQLVGYGVLTATSGGATATLNLVLVGHGYVTFGTNYQGDSNYYGSSSTLYKYI
jgi:hypothetical protein